MAGVAFEVTTLIAGGAYSPSHFYSVAYPQQLVSEALNISQLEALNLVHAVASLLPLNPHHFSLIVHVSNNMGNSEAVT